jgi:hypothetical protein
VSSTPLAAHQSKSASKPGCRPGVGPGCSGYNFRTNCHSLPTVGDTDDVYDPGRRLVYVIGGEVAVEVLRQYDSDHYERVGRIPTAPESADWLFVRAFHRLTHIFHYGLLLSPSLPRPCQFTQQVAAVPSAKQVTPRARFQWMFDERENKERSCAQTGPAALALASRPDQWLNRNAP